MLVMGFSAAAFSTTRRSTTRSAPSKTGPRQMLKESAIVEIYRDRYLVQFREKSGPRLDFTLDAIEQLLAEAANDQQADVADTQNQVGSFRAGLKTMLSQNGRKKDLRPQFAKTHKLTTLQLLNALEVNMVHESFAFNVDYFSLHIRSFKLLRTIVAEMDSIFLEYCGPGYLEKESQLPFMVGMIFRISFGTTKAMEDFLPRLRRGNETFSGALDQASKIVQRFIKKEGQVELEKVKKASHVFTGIKCESSPTWDIKALASTVQAFNVLPRKQTVDTELKGPNHWHFSIRTVGPRLNPSDLVYLISPENGLMHCAFTARGENILALPTLADQADMAILLLLQSFVNGLLKGNQAHLPKFAPWSWSCNDSALAKIIEEKFKTLGVREELCTVQRGSADHDSLSDDLWSGMKAQIIVGFAR